VLWLLPSSWDRWAAVFEEAGYTALTPGWPDDPETFKEANANPEAMDRSEGGHEEPRPRTPADHLRREGPHGPTGDPNPSYKKQARNEGVTEIVEIPNRGHALTIDSGWREVADTALAFLQRFANAHEPQPAGRALAATR
jgi:hypothetical protein